MNAQRGSMIIALLCLQYRPWMRVGGQHHAPAASPPGKRLATHCIGGLGGRRASLDVCGKPQPPPHDSIPGPSTQSLYLLNYHDTRWLS